MSKKKELPLKLNNTSIIEIEESVLASLMVKPICYHEISSVVKPFMFLTYPKLALLIIERIKEELEVGVLTVCNEYDKLINQGKNDEHISSKLEISKIGGKVSLGNVLNFAKRIKENYFNTVELNIAKESYDLLNQSYSYLDVRKIQQAKRDELDLLEPPNRSSRSKDIAEVLDEIEAAKNSDGIAIEIDTGYDDLNSMFGGWHAAEVVVLAGRPGMGKTTAIINYLMRGAERGNRVVLFSIEMTKKQILRRINSMYSGVTVKKMRTGDLTNEEMERIKDAFSHIYELPFEIVDDISDIDGIIDYCKRFDLDYGLDMMAIDYIQLLVKDERYQSAELSNICNKLKKLSKQCNCAVFPLSQLNRTVETRGGTKRPIMSDLRGSGAIEQVADTLIFFYRPEYYGILEDEEGKSLKGLAEWIVKKNRHGATDTLLRSFVYPYAEFLPYEDQDLDEVKEEVNPEPVVNEMDYGRIEIEPSRMNNDEDIPF